MRERFGTGYRATLDGWGAVAAMCVLFDHTLTRVSHLNKGYCVISSISAEPGWSKPSSRSARVLNTSSMLTKAGNSSGLRSPFRAHDNRYIGSFLAKALKLLMVKTRR